VVFRAEIKGENAIKIPKDAAKSKESKDTVLAAVRKKYDITEVPKFYYEAKIHYSEDRTSFKLMPQYIYYGDRIGPHKNDKQLVLSLAFSLPASGEETAFAHSDITLKRGEGVYHVSDRTLLNSFDSKYFPLPKPSVAATEAITLYLKQKNQLDGFYQQRNVGENLDEKIADFESKIAKMTKDIDSKIYTAKLSYDIAFDKCKDDSNCDPSTNETVIKLKTELQIAERHEKLTGEKEELKTQLAAYRKKKTYTQEKANLDRSIEKLEEAVKQSEKYLSELTPVNVNVTLTETTDANEFLKSVGQFLVDNTETIKTKATEVITDKLTPADPETTLKNKVDKLSALSVLQTNAITSVGTWYPLHIKYINTTNVKQKVALFAELKGAYRKEQLDCDIVEANHIFEEVCLQLTPPVLPSIED